jgi:hypothetical protein
VEIVIVEVAVVEDCERETLGGRNCVVGEDEVWGETDADSNTIPVKRIVGIVSERVRVTFALEPACMVWGGGFEANWKSAA